MPSPEQALWQAVLITAIDDALLGVSGESKLNRPGADRAAKGWFQRPTRDFLDVRNLAGLDPEAVHDRMTRHLAEIEEHPEVAPRRKTSTTRKLTNAGETLSVAEWSERTGLPSGTISGRIDSLGWTVERALSQPNRMPRPRAPAPEHDRGVPLDLCGVTGTGVGSSPQDRTEIVFQQEDAA